MNTYIGKLRQALTPAERKILKDIDIGGIDDELKRDLALINVRLYRQHMLLDLLRRGHAGEEGGETEERTMQDEKNYFDRLYKLEALLEKTQEQRIKLLLKLAGLRDDGDTDPAEAWLMAVCGAE